MSEPTKPDRRKIHQEPIAVRLEMAKRLLRLSKEKGRKPAERDELRRMGLAWAETLPEGPEKARLFSLDER